MTQYISRQFGTGFPARPLVRARSAQICPFPGNYSGRMENYRMTDSGTVR